MDKAQTEETAIQAAKKRQEWLVNYLKSADEHFIDGLMYYCKYHKLLMLREPPADTDSEMLE